MRQLYLKIIRSIFNFLFFTCLGAQVKGVENIPPVGGLIIAPNHMSNFDPPLVGTACWRMICFMAKEELFKNPIIGKLIALTGTFPIRRGRVDTAAIRVAYSILKSGGVVGIFPEGTRSTDGQIGIFHEGMAAIAIKTGVPIVPTAVIGTRTLPKKNGPIIVAFGEPIRAKSRKVTKEMVAEINEEVKSAIVKMINQYEGDRHGN